MSHDAAICATQQPCEICPIRYRAVCAHCEGSELAELESIKFYRRYEAGQVLFVGDNYYDDVVGAQKVGIDCLLLAPYGTLGMEEIHHPYTVPQLADIAGILGLNGEGTT